VQARQCAFAPHRAIFQFEEPAATGHALPRAEVRLDHCTALLDRTTVFHFEGPADCQVKAGNSLFGQANPPGAETDAVLVRVNRRGSVRYEAEGGESGPKRNGYFGLSAFWSDEARPDRPERAVNLSDCTRLPGRPIAEDPGAELPVRPWQDSRPLAVLVRDPARAFRLDTAQSRLRVGGPASPLLGVRHCVNWPERDLSPTPLPPATDSGSLAQSVRVVDPSAAAGRQAGVYATVAAAVAEAQSGDVLLLKHNGDLRADPVDLKKERLALTIRPFPGYRPTLVLNEEAAREKLTALFRVFDGSLVLDGLQVSLRPQDSNRYAGLSLVAVVGGGSCEVRNCVVTLDAAGDFRPSVWALDNPEDVMKMMGAATSAPRLDLRNCLVRGKGHLLDVRSGRPFALSADNAVIALDGSLLSADLARKERPAGEADVRLERVTAHLTDYLLALRGADSRVGTVRLRCVASDCLFVPPAGGRSLVRVDGTDSEKAFQQLVGWQGQGNVYSDAIMQWVDLEGGADAMPAVPLGERDWVRLFGDADRERTVAAVRLQGLPADRPLTRARAEDFRPTYRAAGPDAEQPRAGATLDRIPSPAE
jgi:hypothetical protein